MTFRIFQVTSDGVAQPVYRDVDAPSYGQAPTSQQDAAAVAAAQEWERLRERLRTDAPARPARSGWLSR